MGTQETFAQSAGLNLIVATDHIEVRKKEQAQRRTRGGLEIALFLGLLDLTSHH